MTAFRILRGSALAAVAGLALATGGAQAQIAGGSSNEPIDITANQWDGIDAERLQIWQGDVEAVQGVNRLRAEELRVYHAAKPGGSGNQLGNWGDPQRMVARGTVYFVTPDSIAKGDAGDYNLLSDVITLTGNVVLTRGESVARGDKLTIDVKSGRSTLDSVAKGRGANRVRGVFYPEQDAPPRAGG